METYSKLKLSFPSTQLFPIPILLLSQIPSKAQYYSALDLKDTSFTFLYILTMG
jgi:hypothetical protein